MQGSGFECLNQQSRGKRISGHVEPGALATEKGEHWTFDQTASYLERREKFRGEDLFRMG